VPADLSPGGWGRTVGEASFAPEGRRPFDKLRTSEPPHSTKAEDVEGCVKCGHRACLNSENTKRIGRTRRIVDGDRGCWWMVDSEADSRRSKLRPKRAAALRQAQDKRAAALHTAADVGGHAELGHGAWLKTENAERIKAGTEK